MKTENIQLHYPLPHTEQLLRLHRYLVTVISLLIALGASISAISRGNEPVLGPIVAIAIMGLFWGVMVWFNKRTTKGLDSGDSQAWLGALFWALTLSIFIIGIPSVRELWAYRHQFFKKGYLT